MKYSMKWNASKTILLHISKTFCMHLHLETWSNEGPGLEGSSAPGSPSITHRSDPELLQCVQHITETVLWHCGGVWWLW